MAIHLLVDANLDVRLTETLAQRLGDVRVAHVRYLGYANANDDEIIALARTRNAVLVTEDRGFDLVRNPICTHPGVIVVPRALCFPDVMASLLRRIWLSGYRHLLDHALTRLEPNSVRIVGPTGSTMLVAQQQRLRVRR